MSSTRAVLVVAIGAALLLAAACTRKTDAPRVGGSAPLETSTRRDPAFEISGSYPSQQQVDVVAYPPTGAVAPGHRFALMIQVTPRTNMHVYAPGADGYKTVALSIVPAPYVHAQRVVYPKSEIYEFKPLKERVPAYQKPFTLVQEMTLEGSAAARAALQNQKSLTITGRFDYQACDDGTCYNPASAPLSWTIALK